MNVDLPEPVLPIIAIFLPCSISMLMLCKATVLPNLTVSLLISMMFSVLLIREVLQICLSSSFLLGFGLL